MHRLISIDIGTKHFAIYAEDIDPLLLNSTWDKYIPVSKSTAKFRMTRWSLLTFPERWEFSQTTGTRVLLDLVNLSEYMDVISTPLYNADEYMALTCYLDSIRNVLDSANTIIIEQQMAQNMKAQKLSQHVISYVMVQYKNKVLDGQLHIKSVQPREKLKVFEAPNGISKNARKKWSTEIAVRFLSERNDTESLEMIESLRDQHIKCDDVADAIMQCQSFKLTKLQL